MRFIENGSRAIGLFKNEAIIGKVESSRIHGKRLVYTIKLDNPISLRWRTDLVDTLLMGANEIKAAPL